VGWGWVRGCDSIRGGGLSVEDETGSTGSDSCWVVLPIGWADIGDVCLIEGIWPDTSGVWLTVDGHSGCPSL